MKKYKTSINSQYLDEQSGWCSCLFQAHSKRRIFFQFFKHKHKTSVRMFRDSLICMKFFYCFAVWSCSFLISLQKCHTNQYHIINWYHSCKIFSTLFRMLLNRHTIHSMITYEGTVITNDSLWSYSHSNKKAMITPGEKESYG